MKEIIETVISPCCGKVEKIYISENSYVYEWEKLMLIQTEDNQMVEIQTGVSGHILSLNVNENTTIDSGTELLKLKDDLYMTGTD
ncbi:biotin/lipoyl-containing protein [Bacillus sp. 03113]|uniref:biotin/lipoyl-containing protein n=1 Tax=Bacillus sp. 03113 TaxID=2578211 RepID=UPI001143DB2F|nr:biotin/lipoyl-containing protein [Bacillus sp. 03113]